MPEVDLLLLDLLGRLLELGLLLHELPLEGLGVEAQHGLAFLDHRPFGDEEGDLELDSGDGRNADLGGAHRRELALDLDALHEVFALDRDGVRTRRRPAAEGGDGDEAEQRRPG